MRPTHEEPGVLLLHGDGIHSWFHISRAGEGLLTSRWEREVDGEWQQWMDMRFERI